MRLRWFIGTALTLVIFITACQGPPPTQIVLVVTATPTPPETASATQTVVVEAATEEATPSLPDITPTTDPMPAPVFNRVQVAEQVFEHGRMFWVQPRQQIWVMIESGPEKGTWQVYEDTFVEGEAETDPSMTPPAGMFQPERGFGKLWRTNQEVRDALGWALTPEFGYVSNYEYHYGGTVDAQNQYVPGPGYQILFSLYNERFQFNEADGTWQKDS